MTENERFFVRYVQGKAWENREKQLNSVSSYV